MAHVERLNGIPMDIMRANDYALFRTAYGAGGDLFQQFVRFLFPISGREKRIMFLPDAYWGPKKPRNKVLKWKRFESDHFDFYAYPESQYTLNTLIKYYEEEYDRNNRVIGVESKFTKKIPIIFYQTRRDFEQTAIVDGPIPEGLGGLTEILSWRRVTFPFEGEWSKFEHVAKHEGVHVFQIAKKAKKVPLWFIEGSAETNSIYWDSDAEMLIRDAFLNGFFFHIRDLWQIEGSWLMYKLGNFICNTIWDEYGEEGFLKIFNNSSSISFENNLQTSLGISLEELDRKVQARALQKYAHLLHRDDIIKQSKRIEEEKIILDSYQNFYVSGGNEGPRNALYINHLSNDGVLTRQKFSEDKVFENESFESFQKGAFINQDHILYAVKRSTHDELRLIPFKYISAEKEFKLQEERVFSWPGIEKIQNPVLINEQNVAFIGYDNGFSNIYLANLDTRKLEKMTSDRTHYADLDYSAMRDELIFSREEERDPKRIFYNRELFTLNLKSRELQRITNSPTTVEIEPRFSPDGKYVLYISTPDTTYDIMLMNMETKQVQRISTMNVGAKRPQWFTNGSILFNSNRYASPSIYQFTIPNAKDLIQSNQPKTSTVQFALKNKEIVLPLEEEKKKTAEELVLDGLYFIDDKPVIRHADRNYTVGSVVTLDDKLIMRSDEGLPNDTRVKREILPHYFELKKKQVTSLKSSMVAEDGISDEIKKWADLQLNGRDIVQSWTSQDHKQALLMVNNRLATEYDSFKKKPEVSVIIYDEETNHMDELEKSPIKSLDQKVQWVAFLKKDQIMIAMGGERTGPFQIFIYHQKKKKYVTLHEEVAQFRISQDQSKMIWKTDQYHLTDFSSGEDFVTTNLDFVKEGTQAFEFNQNDQPVFFSYVEKNKKWMFTTYQAAQKRYFTQELAVKDDMQIQKVAISAQNIVAIVAAPKDKEKKKFQQIWIWKPEQSQSFQLEIGGDYFSSVVFRKNLLTGFRSFYDSRLSEEFLWTPNDSKSFKDFDDLHSMKPLDQYVIFEGTHVLANYDQATGKSNLIDKETFGYSIEKDEIVFSSKEDDFFQISSFNLITGNKKKITTTPYNKWAPSLKNKELVYMTEENHHWNMETLDLSTGKVTKVESASHDFIKTKEEKDRILVEAQSRNTEKNFGPEHPYQTEYPTMLQSQPVRYNVKLQNLAAAAAYDGDNIRYFISAYADNLFSDKGVYVNSMFLENTRFATVGYSDLNTGHNYAFFYNFRDGIENMGLDFSKNYIFDQYRQFTPYVDFEFQNYASNSSTLNPFIDPKFNGESYYIGKLGMIYSYDVSVWDRHGPASGSRFYSRFETGMDMGNTRFSNADVNVDIRVYNRVLPRFGFAHRLSGGTSQGPIPNIYLVGGNMSFRGVGFDDIVGQNYWVFSEDIRLPIFDFVGAKFFDPLDYALGFFTRFFDVRAGLYADVGSAWFNGQDPDLLYSVGYFVNIPTAFGLIVRLNQGFLGEKKFGLWFGANW